MIAITREVPATVDQGLVTYRQRVSVDVARAREQHRQYRDALRAAGCEVIVLPADDEHPDSVFVEDTAIVLDDLAVITRPGADSRRGETRSIAEALPAFRPLVHIEAPATIDGGDVLVLDDLIFVGMSTRTNEDAIAQLKALTGRSVVCVDVRGALHLKSAVTRVGKDTVLAHRDWVDLSPFAGWNVIEAAEPNALLVNGTVIYPSGYPETADAMRAQGIDVRTIDADELAKLDGGVTCCSLLIP